jgi:TorA maturation chaperone TorD
MESLSTELKVLASLLAYPDQDTKEVVQELAAHYHWLEPAASELETLSLAFWQAEYTRLFEGESPCPPYESVYMSGRMHGPQEAELREFYRRLGMNHSGAPEDYLGTLLECAAMVNANPEVGRDYWSELWNGHLRQWVPRFCFELRHHSRMTLYRVVAERLCVLFPELQQNMAVA